MEKKIKLKLNKQIVSNLNNVKGGTDVTRTCPVHYSAEPETEPTRGGTGICYTDACLPSKACTLEENCVTFGYCG